MSAKLKKHLLVIRLSAMGDCAIAVPVLRRLVHAYPQIRVTVLTKPFFSSIFKTVPGVEVIAADTKGKHKGFWGVLKLGFQLRKRKFDAVADLHNVLRSKILRTIFFFSGIKAARIDKGRADKKALTRPKNKIFKPLKTSAERYADVFAALGYTLDLTEEVSVEKPALSSKLAAFINDSIQKWIGVAPFTAHESKAYPIDLMTRVIEELDKTSRYKLLLFGGGKEEIKKLSAIAEKYKNTVCVAGQLPFPDELKVLGNLDLMLSMDSGNGHLAAMFGVPVVTLWGSTHPYLGFVPFGQPEENQLLPDLKRYPLLPTSVFGKKQVPGYEEVMRSIAPATVLERVEEILGA